MNFQFLMSINCTDDILSLDQQGKYKIFAKCFGKILNNVQDLGENSYAFHFKKILIIIKNIHY